MTINATTLLASRSTAGSIKNWVNNSAIPETDILAEAEAWIYSKLRVRDMLIQRTQSDEAISAATTEISLPTGYRQTYNFMLTGTEKAKMTFKELFQLEDMYSYDSAGARVQQKPRFFAENATQLAFNCPSDATYTYLWTYYGDAMGELESILVEGDLNKAGMELDADIPGGDFSYHA